MIGELVFMLSLLLVIGYCVIWIVRRNLKRRNFGKKLLMVRDVTSNIDLFFAITFLLLGVRTLALSLNDRALLDMIFLAWPIYTLLTSPIYFIRAFSRVVIFEEGILTRDSLWKWDIAEAYSLKEEKKTIIFNFKLNRRFYNSRRIVILKKDRDMVEKAIKQIFKL